MNISKIEQRVLHVLAQGGFIRHKRADNGRVIEVTCLTRDGYGLLDCNLQIYRKLKHRKLIQSIDGKPYRISRRGRIAVRSQFDNR